MNQDPQEISKKYYTLKRFPKTCIKSFVHHYIVSFLTKGVQYFIGQPEVFNLDTSTIK